MFLVFLTKYNQYTKSFAFPPELIALSTVFATRATSPSDILIHPQVVEPIPL
ncbi:MAG: hypothetical protein MR739_07775 [Spirochaetia bacterium]|nr:hypothetical protein [Spirochaetia bacterium]